jgi:hypothetical protein
MAGVRGRSGPPANTNAAKYGWRVLWRRALIREQDRWVQRPMEQYIGALMADKPDASAGEQNCIEIAATAKGCSLLILHELKQHGLTRAEKGALELTSVGADLRKFLELELKALKVLGLGRRARQVQTLDDYLASRSNAGAAESEVNA